LSTSCVYDDNKQAIEQAGCAGPGTDSMWNTADDVVSYYSRMAYEANGNMKDTKGYSAGPDGILKNADDVVTADGDFDVGR
jgi:hypothetical protein